MEQISTSLKQLKQQQGIEVSELEQLIAQALAPPSSRKKHDDQKISKSGGGMQTSSGDSSLSKSSDSISRASPPSSPTDLSASTSAQSNSMLYSHARRQFMQHQLPRNRHPSTYTLESLQRANPTKPASK